MPHETYKSWQGYSRVAGLKVCCIHCIEHLSTRWGIVTGPHSSKWQELCYCAILGIKISTNKREIMQITAACSVAKFTCLIYCSCCIMPETVDLMTRETPDFMTATFWPPNSPGWLQIVVGNAGEGLQRMDQDRRRTAFAWDELDQRVIHQPVAHASTCVC